MKVRNPEKRLRAFVSLCQPKRQCEHTGGPQPTYRLEHGTLKILAEFPAPKDGDDEEMAPAEAVERKQARRPLLRAAAAGGARVLWGAAAGCRCQGAPCRR